MIMMMKKNLSLNKEWNDIVNLMEYIENVVDVEIQIDPVDDNKFIISMDELMDDDENEFIFYRNEKYMNILKILHDEYNIDHHTSKNDDNIEIKIYNHVKYPIIHNKELLIEIFDDNVELIRNVYDELQDEKIIEIIHDEIHDKYDEIMDDDKIDMKSFNLIDIMDIFNNILYYHKHYELRYLIKLFEYVIDDFKKFINNDIIESKIKINIDNTNIIHNKHIGINNYFFDVEIIENILKYDIDYNIDNDIIDQYQIWINDDINVYEFFEKIYIDNLNDELNISMNYHYENKDNGFIECYIELSIDELIKILYEIDDKNDDENHYKNLFNLSCIDDIFESLNNSMEFDDFIYLILENEYEYVYDDEFYDKWNYEINKYNIQFNSIYDLKEWILNHLSNLNLNKSFKFDDELYEIY